MGFGTVHKADEELEVLPEDLVYFGMIPEFVGRFPLIQKLEKLQVDDLLHVLLEPKNSLVNQYKKSYKYDDVDLDFDRLALEKIAKIAYGFETGARGLKQVIEKVLFDFSFNIDKYKGQNLKITEQDVERSWKKILKS
jgi:ATP-dependent Clp protease ATP-binding subunit ClpX